MRRAVVRALINSRKTFISHRRLLFTVFLFLATGRVGRERQAVSIEEKKFMPAVRNRNSKRVT